MIETLSATGSTNADLLGRLAAGEAVAECVWLVADRQTAGRGRLGRQWSDGLGNFMGSTAVHMRAGDPHAGSLALVAGLAVQAAVAGFVLPPLQPLLKWPNDVMVGAAKLAGILLEKAGDTVVVGVGVNLAQAPDIAGRPTVAVAQFGPPPSRDAFALALAQGFTEEVARWRREGLAATVARWQAVAHPVGTALRFTGGDGTVLDGRFAGLDGQGALLLDLADGARRTIHAGEVQFSE